MAEAILRAAVRTPSETQEGEDNKLHFLSYNCQSILDMQQPGSPETQVQWVEITSLKTKIYKIIQCLCFVFRLLVQTGKIVVFFRWVKVLAGNQGHLFLDTCLEANSFCAGKQIIFSLCFLWTTFKLFHGAILKLLCFVICSHQLQFTITSIQGNTGLFVSKALQDLCSKCFKILNK